MDRVKGKVAIVTGAALGMGRAFALRLAQEQASVVVTDVNEREGERTVATIRAQGGDAVFHRHDVSSAEDWARLMSSVLERHARVDVLVNNAGILAYNAVDKTEVEEWDRVQAVNARGCFLGCKSVLPAMQAAGGGSIVNCASNFSHVGAPGFAAYISSKGTVRALTKAVAADYAGYNIRVNSLHPGVVLTEMTKAVLADPVTAKLALGPTLMGRAGRVEELAAVVLFLASDESSYMTASEVVVDGGYSGV